MLRLPLHYPHSYFSSSLCSTLTVYIPSFFRCSFSFLAFTLTHVTSSYSLLFYLLLLPLLLSPFIPPILFFFNWISISRHTLIIFLYFSRFLLFSPPCSLSPIFLSIFLLLPFCIFIGSSLYSLPLPSLSLLFHPINLPLFNLHPQPIINSTSTLSSSPLLPSSSPPPLFSPFSSFTSVYH